MSRKSEVTITWTCDVCGATEPEVDGYSPNGWKQIAHCLASAQLGNVAAQHLCGNCSTSLHLLLSNRLGDAGDLEQAWDEGYELDRAKFDERANPYRDKAAR